MPPDRVHQKHYDLLKLFASLVTISSTAEYIRDNFVYMSCLIIEDFNPFYHGLHFKSHIKYLDKLHENILVKIAQQR